LKILDFLLSSREDLQGELDYYVYGVLASNAIEEFELLKEFLIGFKDLTRDQESVQNLSGINFIS